MSNRSSLHALLGDRCLVEGLEARRLYAASATKIGDVLNFLASDFSSRPEARLSRSAYRNKPYTLAAAQPNKAIVRTAGDGVLVKAVANAKGGAKLATQLEAIGATVSAVYGVMISATVPVSVLASLDGLSALNYADASYAPKVSSAGRVEDLGDQAMNADHARREYAVDGTGITVGVMSDSYNKKTGATITAATDISTGDLPPAANLNIVKDETAAGTDEGRAMMQIVHDIAPGASEAYYTAFNGEADFASGILTLAKPTSSGGAGARVIVDDVFYYDEPMFQDGIVAQAVNTAHDTYGASYFSAAENQGTNSYESNFNTVVNATTPAGTGTYHDFDPSNNLNVYQQVTIPAGATFNDTLEWNSPYASASANAGGTASSQNSLGLYLVNSAQTALLASAATNRVGGDAYQVLSYTNTGTTALTAYLTTKVTNGAAPTFIKHVVDSGGTIATFATNSPTSFGHPVAAGAMGTAAAAYFQTPAFNVSPAIKEGFSSLGGTGIRFNANGTAKATIEFRQQPAITAPDGAATTFFGGQDNGLDGQYHFYGTSSAAPHAAAVAALMLDLDPTLTNVQIYNALKATASDMATAGFDYQTGFGLVQADDALAYLGSSSVSGFVYRDLNGNGVKDGSDTGVANQTVYIDSDADNTYESGTTTTSASPALAIPDATASTNAPSRVTTNLFVSTAQARVTSVSVNLNISHSYMGDVGITLISPHGIRVPLLQNLGGLNASGAGVNLTLSDSATSYIQNNSNTTGVLTGTYKPESPLAAAVNEFGAGTWQLEARDYAAGGTGTINSWSLTISYADPSVTTFSSGGFIFGGLAPSAFFGYYQFRTLGLSGYQLYTPSNGTNSLYLTEASTVSNTNFGFAQLPTVASLVFDDGTAQRSRLRYVDVTFLGTIASAGIGASAFSVVQTSGSTINTYTATVTSITTPAAGQTKVRVTFGGSAVVGGSLADGRYYFQVNGFQITNPLGIATDAAGTGSASARTYNFHRLFGDYDGDAGVSINDFNQFATAFGTVIFNPAYKAAFDYDADNGISINDFNQFATRFGRTI